MRILSYSYTNKGGRERNEDCLRCSADGETGLFVLADGLGGHVSGEIASKIAVDTIFERRGAQGASNDEDMAALLRAANGEIMDAQSAPGRAEMKTTAVALSVTGCMAAWAHIGDSRLYYFSGGELRHVTHDHSVTFMKYLGGEITYNDIYHDDDRSRLLRALGKEPCKPESGGADLHPGDAFLLCSDGFWEYLYNEEMLADLLKSRNPGEWARFMLLRHMRASSPGNDNFSLITVFAED